ncbi:hypothetical protein EPA93_02505 [Ktedonosporobacter rubrisoli]|uniref:Ferritin-like domain-containing protein n=1 Tax=Ktedonosporobacter rubrisoli TaxID=2509675 RepID=A0A4V0YY43_KTERU|nr:ferritin-like domain-containing protein [Ktedonosporobacter rubrisoli]QBD74921.1 hypothetical protein EPA93_02505 [Ktedonosporobacter rubrisoli]
MDDLHNIIIRRTQHDNGEEDRAQAKLSRRSFFLRSAATAAITTPIAGLLVAQTAHAASRSAHNLSVSDAFHEIRKDEDAHVAFLKATLGRAARPKPRFKNLQQHSSASFVNLSLAFENVGVGAYLQAAPALSSKAHLTAASSMLTIEARHAGYLNALVGKLISPNGAFDRPISQSQIVKDVLPFIDNLNGGPDPAKALKNDTDILNFALLLEYLEDEFYDINVPKFY